MSGVIPTPPLGVLPQPPRHVHECLRHRPYLVGQGWAARVGVL
jgi:hypothetical protein